ncbi:MAG: insulinase family protein [Rhodobacteraceae bacterium]|nr:insulinase family protein [Paracoccaceae bacterium]
MRRLFPIWLSLVIATAGGTALSKQEITSFTLENGMDVVIVEDHRAPVAIQMIWYKVGAADEPAGQSGIAHFLEHLMFRGTELHGLGEFQRTVQLLGGSDNGFTSRDFTGYNQRVAADRLEKVMELEADRMTGLLMTEEDVEVERQVVLEERNERTDSNPHALFSEQRNAALYLNHPYGIPVIGWRHEIAEINREELFEFYRSHYVPNNATLVIAGDVEPDLVRELAMKHYGDLVPNPNLKERMRPQEPPHLAPRRLSATDPRVAQPYLVRLYLAPERNPGEQKNAAALEILAEILGGGVTSVLSRKLEIEGKIAVQASAFYNGLALDRTTFGFIVVPVEGIELEEAEIALDQVLKEFLESGVDEDQLNRVKTQIRAAWIYGQDDVYNQAYRYGQALTAGLSIEDVQAWPEILQSVTGEDVISAAVDVLEIKNSVTGWLSGEEIE